MYFAVGLSMLFAGSVVPTIFGEAHAQKSEFKKRILDPGCFWSDEKKKVICIYLPPKIPKLTGGGGCGGSSACGGNNRGTVPRIPPEFEAKILTIDPGTITKAGAMKAIKETSGLNGNQR